jgi:hypothetical protein
MERWDIVQQLYLLSREVNAFGTTFEELWQTMPEEAELD